MNKKKSIFFTILKTFWFIVIIIFYDHLFIGNFDTCYLTTLNWPGIVGTEYDRKVHLTGGSITFCSLRQCSVECPCGYCVGPSYDNCVLTEDCSSKNNDGYIIGILVGLAVFLAATGTLSYMCVTNRCGCLLRCGYNPWARCLMGAIPLKRNSKIFN